MTVEKRKVIHLGNAVMDGVKGWFVGDTQDEESLRRRADVWVKYGIHHAGQECAEPWKEWSEGKRKVTLSVLIEGGPFVHWFRNDKEGKTLFTDGTKEDVKVLEKVGDYLIYEPGVFHRWKALKSAVVITVQYPVERTKA